MMKDTNFILSECHPPTIKPADQSINQTVAVWLTKELRK
jgi:hypothetical protein